MTDKTTSVGLKTNFRNDRMVLPFYEHEGDSGMDLRWNGEPGDEVWILPGYRVTLETGLWPTIPPGVEIQIRSKSGLAAKHGIHVLNSPGTVDSSYLGEIKVVLHNSSVCESFRVRAGDKIAQAVLCPVLECDWILPRVGKKTTRGGGGFGSTGN